ncbi:hypothetical protein SAMN05519103_02192 [Rhizobiales bacterium GAS113]|nr:hypothetical protein SAMN05519103_02192 [Rhizobiales bacterium GAS113]SEB90564.1 hypothetical protein SAMN05519104_0358 [Rhizobiales bacterium GAS188]
MGDKFTIESRTTEALKVRHVASGLRYTFRVSKPKSGHRVLKGVYSPGSASSRSNREVLEKSARAFAEREARKADLID